MKKLVGKRKKADLELKAVIALVEICVSGASRPSVKEFNKTCAKCKAPVKITLSEDIDTGEIWMEGPDNCEKCGHQLSDENVAFQPLSQEAIKKLFGIY